MCGLTVSSSKIGGRRFLHRGALLGSSAVAFGTFASPAIVLAQWRLRRRLR